MTTRVVEVEAVCVNDVQGPLVLFPYWTSYVVIADPPFELGAVQVTVD